MGIYILYSIGLIVTLLSFIWAIKVSLFMKQDFLPAVDADVGDIIAHISPSFNVLLERKEKLRIVGKSNGYYKCVKLNGWYQYDYTVLPYRTVCNQYYKYMDWDDDIVTVSNI
jgi:hypothetical protein